MCQGISDMLLVLLDLFSLKIANCIKKKYCTDTCLNFILGIYYGEEKKNLYVQQIVCLWLSIIKEERLRSVIYLPVIL